MARATSTITLDGELNEAAWQEAAVAQDFAQNFPDDDGMAEGQTVVRLTYDDEFLYVGAICYTDPEEDYVITSLRRDFDFGSNDNLCIYIDPFNDLTNGFMFGSNPWGVQREGLVSNGNDVSTDWDNKWYVETTRFDDHWVMEMAIPFRTLRYKPDNREWNMQFLRNDLKLNERSCWVRVPQGYRFSSLVFTGKLYWEENPPKANGRLTVIPYVSGAATQNFEADENPGQINPVGNVGADAKVAVTSALNLDLTLNPDFSQVEVDRQVTNLDRFELFFPERRQFFLENSDLFAENGFRSIRPFYSRRIGLGAPVLFGARLSGKPNQKWRVGLLNVQTGRVEADDLPANNFTVASFQRQVFTRSVLSGIVVNKQATSPLPSDSTGEYRPFNRVAGLDFNLRSADDRWNGKAFYHRSFDSEVSGESYAHAVFFGYSDRNMAVFWNHEMVGENYTAATGFVRRTGYLRFEPFARYNFYPESGPIQQHGPRVRLDMYSNSPYSLDTVLDRNFSVSYSVDFLNTSRLEAQYTDNYTLLFQDFDPAGTLDSTDLELLAGTSYRFRRYQIEGRTDRRRWWNVGGQIEWGQYFNGHRLEVRGGANVRFQPYGNFSLDLSYNRIRLPEGFGSTDLWLIAPRLDVTFTDKLFWTTFVQYNTQTENFGVNTRFQWRFAPVSDLFVVYTDNYLVPGQEWMPRNRGLVMKLTYWLNL